MKVKDLLPVFLIFILSTVLIFTWFEEGYMYGGGDVGLPSYDPARTLEKSAHIWWEASAPGATIPQGLTSVPFQVFQSFLHNLGLSPVMVQATIFWSLLFTMGLGMYYLGLIIFEKKPLLATIAALFYMFNPYMMIQIWHRFIHNTFFLAAAFPFMYIFWKGWVKTGSFTKLLLFILTNLLGVYLFGTIAFVATILILVIFISLVEVLFPWQGWKKFQLIFNRSILGLIFWSLVNIWWLWPVLTIATASLSLQHSIGESLGTLLAISRQAIVPYSILGINSFYLYDKADWGEIYSSYLFRLLSCLSLIFLIPGFIKGLKNRNWLFWPLLFTLALFLAKGAASPFGYIYIWSFNHFFALGALRNPFEKLGIFLPFSSAILLTIGVNWYLEFKGYLRFPIRIAIILLMVLLLVVYLWPMWLGKVFGTLVKPSFVEVPSTYQAADNFIKTQGKSGKILHLPLTSGESITYNWFHGYHGVEPSQLLFKSLPSISHGFNVSPVDDALTALSRIFLLPDSEDKILAILQSFNVKFIVLHKDIEWHGGYLEEPQKLENRLNEFKFLENKTQFGDLIVYELKDEYFYPRLRLTDRISYIISSENTIYWPWLLSSGKTDLLSSLQKKKEPLLIKHGTELIISPEQIYKYSPQKIIKENILGEMPAAKVLPDSFLYPFIRIKENIKYFSLPVNDKFSFKVTLAGKRLTESYFIKQKDSSRSVIPQLQEYQQILAEIKDGVHARSNGSEGSKELSINFILSRHLATLELIKEKMKVKKEIEIVEETINQLTDLMKEANIIPYSHLIERENLTSFGRLISRFNVPVSGKYELLQAYEQSQGIYPNDLRLNDFQINNEVKILSGRISGTFLSFGAIDLHEGLNEISFNSIPSINLSTVSKDSWKGNIKKNDNEIEITSSEHTSSYVDLNIEPVHGGSWYQLSFDSWFRLGDSFKVQVFQDTDPYDLEKPGEKVPSYDNDFHRDAYINDWNNNVFNFYINPTTTKVTIRLLIIPWDGCKYFLVSKTICSNKLVKYIYEKSGKVAFKNISVIRPLSNPIFLKLETTSKPALENKNTIKYTQRNVTSYSGNMNITAPGFLIFSETFHPGWRLELYNPKKYIPSQRFIANNYGNAWYIENPGSYYFKLEFTPERKVTNGLIISGASMLGILVLVIKQKKKQ